MTERTTQDVVSFSSPFMLPGFDRPQPAGDYRIEHDEEMIHGISRIAWRRVRTHIHIPAIGKIRAIQQMVPVEPADLDAALEIDTRRQDAAAPVQAGESS